MTFINKYQYHFVKKKQQVRLVDETRQNITENIESDSTSTVCKEQIILKINFSHQFEYIGFATDRVAWNIKY